MIPFTIQDIKFDDRVYHIFIAWNIKIQVFLWKINYMSRNEVNPDDDTLFSIWTDKLKYKIYPFLSWNNCIFIDRRPRWKRVLNIM